MKLTKFFLFLLLFVSSPFSYSKTHVNNKLLHNLRSFAFASCLANQNNETISEEGKIWSNSLNEGNSELKVKTVMTPINEYINKSLRESSAYYITFYEHSEDHSKTLLIATCYDLISKPSTEKFLRNIYKKILKSR
ncbi:hypothetical protein [Taylorella equigenitalis]|uniref:Exported protein n=1 Tax=Taylorella equigenitalis ATCC 35865 TaxID=743973 RepID=A0ABN4AU49_9BURK|nr:hypothetical protein [Taylorella equigenitalis]AFN35229.1 putative exported protein [Taylorella equigenitalis ATCC 35865]ASY38668.1 hypothetical protein CA604_00620 [Taylorella equigenitalis]WDU54947.1 hypothetical protein KPZ19_00550 [Taylorella equigenitalis]VEG30257.1 Uncharacterised protein [Taylorella equigenitalis ATCC 35865]